MWYKQVLSQFGGGVISPGQNESKDTADSQSGFGIADISDVDNQPAGLYN